MNTLAKIGQSILPILTQQLKQCAWLNPDSLSISSLMAQIRLNVYRGCNIPINNSTFNYLMTSYEILGIYRFFRLQLIWFTQFLCGLVAITRICGPVLAELMEIRSTELHNTTAASGFRHNMIVFFTADIDSCSPDCRDGQMNHSVNRD